MDRRAFLILSAAGLLQPDAAAPPPGSPDTPGGPDPETAAFQAWLRDFTIRAIAAGWDAELVTTQLAGLTVTPKVVELDVIRSLASLAYDGRRRDWAETQIFGAFRMIQEGDATRAQLRGSWAG